MLKRKLDTKIIEQLELLLVEQLNGNFKLKLREKFKKNQNFPRLKVVTTTLDISIAFRYIFNHKHTTFIILINNSSFDLNNI
jgi:hypothetical protein